MAMPRREQSVGTCKSLGGKEVHLRGATPFEAGSRYREAKGLPPASVLAPVRATHVALRGKVAGCVALRSLPASSRVGVPATTDCGTATLAEAWWFTIRREPRWLVR